MRKLFTQLFLLFCVDAHAQWAAVSSIPAATTQHAAVGHPNGNIYLFGGATNTSTYAAISTMRVYNTVSDSWSIGASLPAARRGIAYCLGTDNKVYAVGGFNGAQTNSTYRYDPSTGSWSTLANLPIMIWEGAAASAGGKIYVAGGEKLTGTTLSASNALCIYNIAAGSWSLGANLPAARIAHKLVAAPSGDLYMFGGSAAVFGGATNTVYKYTVASNSWSFVASMPASLILSGACLAPNGNIYVTGGTSAYALNTGPYTSASYIFNPTTNSFTTGPALPGARGENTLAASPNTLYCMGGVNGSSILSANLELKSISAGPISGSPFCPGEVISVPTVRNGSFSSSTTYTVQLSSSTGSFTSPTTIGTYTGATSGTFSATIPTTAAAGAGYRIRVNANDPFASPSSLTGDDNGTNLTISAQVVPSVSISASPGTSIFSSTTSITFTANPTNGGTSPTYQWKKNGVNVGTGSTYTSASWTTGDVVSVTMTSNAACPSPTTDVDSKTITVYTATACDLTNYNSVTKISPSSFPYTSPTSGITVSATLSSGMSTTANATGVCNGVSYNCSNPAWVIGSASGQSITLNFSSAVNNFSFIVNGSNTGEIFTVTPSSGNATLSNYCATGFSAIGNQLHCLQSSGGGSVVTVTNNKPVTQYVITHNAAGAGSRLTLLDCYGDVPIGPGGINRGVQLWLDASNVNNTVPATQPANNSNISTWKDISRNGNNATVFSGQGTPNLSSAQINGKDVMTFTRTATPSGDVYEVLGLDIRSSVTPAMTHFTVHRPTSTPLSTAAYGLWGNLLSGADDRYYVGKLSGNNNGLVSTGNSTVAVPNAGIPGRATLTTVVYNAGATNGSAVYKDAQLAVNFTDVTNPTNSYTHMLIGSIASTSTGSYVYHGDIAEMIVYNRILSPCEMKSVNKYLAYKYGLELSTVAVAPAFTDTAFCSTASLNLTTGGGTAYQWMYNNALIGAGGTSASYTPAQSGSYKVIVTANGCPDTSAAMNVTIVPSRIYVDSSKAVSGSGASWTSAVKTLSEALYMANHVTCPVEIWLKKGTYYPGTSAGGNTTSRDSSFRILRNNIKVYGGFAGTETSLSQRNLATNITTLSGDIGTVNNSTDNSYHVVTVHGTATAQIDTNTVLNGLKITLGQAFGAGSDTLNGIPFSSGNGAGIYLIGQGTGNKCSPLIENCTISNNAGFGSVGIYYSSSFGAYFQGGSSGGVLRNCTISSNSANTGAAGVAIFGPQSDLVVSGCTISGNNAVGGVGGGVFCQATSAAVNPSFTNCTFSANTAGNGGGGGIFTGTGSRISFKGCTFSDNLTNGSGGGALYCSTDITLDSCFFARNKANFSTNGGGLYVTIDTTSLNRCVFSDNNAANAGGAISVEGNGRLVMDSTSFSLDSAAIGGGIYVGTGSTVYETDCRHLNGYASNNGGGLTVAGASASVNAHRAVFAGNVAALRGGGIDVASSTGSVTIVNSIVYANSTTSSSGTGGGGAYVTATGILYSYNSTFFENTTANTTNNSNALLIPISANCFLYNTIVWGTAATQASVAGVFGRSYSDIKGFSGGTGNINTNPLFYNAADPNGGDNIWGTADDGLQLTNCSTALNAGLNSNVPSGVVTDITGDTRIQPTTGGTVDMGAYEGGTGSQIAYVDAAVTSSGTGDSWATAYKTLTEALTAVNTNACLNEVRVKAGTYKPVTASGATTTARDSTFRISRNGVKVYGGFSNTDTTMGQRNPKTNATILSGDIGTANDSTDNSYTVITFQTLSMSSATDTVHSVLDGFTITRGNSNAGYPGGSAISNFNLAGGLVARASVNLTTNLDVTTCIFLNNFGVQGGGALSYANGSGAKCNLTIYKSIFERNNGYVGGAATGFSYPAGSQGKMNIYGSLFLNNTGVFCNGYTGWGEGAGSLTTNNITNCTFYGQAEPPFYNLQPNSGVSNVTVSNCIVWRPGSAYTNISFGTGFTFNKNDLYQSTASGSNINTNPYFIKESDPDGADNIWGTSDDGLQLATCSPAINAGSNAYVPATLTTDFNSAARIQQGLVDMGAYESSDSTNRIYVNGAVAASGNGNSWATAFKTVSEALAYVHNFACANEIWVAAGTYYPATASGAATTVRDSSFRILRNGIKLYGGFAGTETSLTQRSITANPTFLSGDIGAVNDSTDNAYHVLTIVAAAGSSIDSSTIVDGFTITRANALNASGSFTINGIAGNRQDGGGVVISCVAASTSCSPKLSNDIITANAANYGGGAYSSGYFSGTSSPVFDNVTFSNNRANVNAGGYFSGCNGVCNSVFRNCTFSYNRAASLGGGIYQFGTSASTNSSLALTSCSFTGNQQTSATGGSSGGAVCVTGGSVSTSATTITNCTFSNNSGYAGAGLSFASTTATIANDTFTSNKGSSGGAFETYASSVTVNNSYFSLDSATFTGGVCRINSGGTVTFNNCQLLNNWAAVVGGIDIGVGNLTANRCVFSGNKGTLGGAINNYSGGPNVATLTNCVFSANSNYSTAGDGGAIHAHTGTSTNISHCTFSENTTLSTSRPSGNALSIDAGATVSIANSILWGTATPQVYNGGTATTFSKSDVRGFGVAGNFNVNPRFVDDSDPDGADDTWATTDDGLQLDQCSPLINQGTNGQTVDIIGAARPQQGTVDLGAYESPYIYSITNPSVAVTASPATIIKPGAAVTFTATASNAGSAPDYQWKMNGSNVGTNSPTYSTSNLANGDIVTCELSSSALCPNPEIVFAEKRVWHIPTLTLTPATACAGDTLTITSTPPAASITMNISGTLQSAIEATWAQNATTVAGGNGSGTGAGQFNQSFDSKIDGNGAIYVVDVNNNRIQKWAPPYTTGITVAGGNGAGPALNQLSSPLGVDVDGSGNIYVTDDGNDRVMRWAPGATSGELIAGGNGNGSGLDQFMKPYGVVVDSVGNVYVSDQHNHRVVRWSPGATTGVLVAGTGTAGSGLNQLNLPAFIFMDRANNLYVADQSNNRVMRWNAGAGFGTVVAGGNGSGTGLNQLANTADLVVDENGVLYTVDVSTVRVQRWLPGATTSTVIAGGNGSGTGANQLNSPVGIDMDAAGNLYVADRGNNRVQKFAVNLTPYKYLATAAGNYSAIVKTFGAAADTTDTTVVNAPLVPSVTVNTAPGDTICAGTNVTFIATPVNGGTTPAYQWLLNSAPVSGAISASYSNAALTNGETVQVRMISSESCASPDTVFSGLITMVVNPNPVITTVAGTNPTTCSGTNGAININGMAASASYSASYFNGASLVLVTSLSSNASGQLSITGLGAGTYSNITVTNAGGCSDIYAGSITLTDPGAPSIGTLSPTNPTTCGGTNGIIALSGLSANVAYVINYSKNGTPQSPYTQLSNGSGVAQILSLSAGSYSGFTVTNPASCTSAAVAGPVVLTDPSAPSITNVTPASPNPCGASNGSLTLQGLTASTTYNVSYFNGTSTVTLPNQTAGSGGAIVVGGLPAGTYSSVTVNLSGCIGSYAGSVAIAPPATTTIAAVTATSPTSCAGNNGSLLIQGLTPLTSYNISYFNGSTTVTITAMLSSGSGGLLITGLSAGTYSSISVTTGTCSGTYGSSVVIAPGPSITTAVSATFNPSTCGGANGSITLNGLTNGNSYVINYSLGGVAQTPVTQTASSGTVSLSGLSAGSYTNISLTFAGCSSNIIAGPITLTSPSGPSASVTTFNNPTTCGGSNGSITLSGLVTGTSYLINYSLGGTAQTPITQTAAGGTLTLNGLGAGSYTNISVTLGSCTSNIIAGPITLSSPTAPAISSVVPANTTLCGLSDGSLSINGLAPSTTYSLSYFNGSATITTTASSGTGGTAVVGGLPAGTYSNISVTLAGCTGTYSGSVTIAPGPSPLIAGASFSNPTTCGGTNGSITLSGLSSGSSYTINYSKGGIAQASLTQTAVGGAVSISGLPAGSYTSFSVTLNGCTSNTLTGPVVLSNPASPVITGVSTLSPTSCGGSNGSFTISGLSTTTTYSLSYFNGSSTISIPSATTTASGSYTVSGLPAGSYSSITATLAGCSGTYGSTVVIAPPSGATIASATGANPTTCGGVNGSIALSGLFANTTYSISYNNGSSTITVPSATTNGSGAVSITGLGSGTYSSLTASLSGCASSYSGTVTLVPPASPVIASASSANPTTCGGSNGSITINGLNPSTAYTISYFNGASTQTISPATTTAAGSYTISSLAAGSYSAITAILNSCSGVWGSSITLNPPATPAAPVAGNGGPICSGATLTLSATPTVTGGIYSWTGPNTFSSGAQNPSVTSATTPASGIYSVTVTVAGCTSAPGTTAATVNQTPAGVTASSNATTPAAICAGATLNLSAASTTPGVGYAWSGPNSFTSAVQNPSITAATTAAGGTYTLTVSNTSAPACSSTATVSVTVNPVPAIGSSSSTNPLTCGGTSGTITLGGLIPSASYTVNYQKNSTAQSGTFSSNASGTLVITGLTQGVYSSISVTLTGCPSNSVGPFTLTDPPIPPAPSASSNSPVCQGTTLSLSASGQTGAAYSWSGPNSYASSIQSPTVTTNMQALNAGTYSVTQSVAGCVSPAATTTVVMSTVPAVPGAISGNGAPCAGQSYTYSISSVATATSYQWTIPSGGGWSTGGSTTASITVTAGSTNGNITVAAINSCGASAGTAGLALNVNSIPAQPGAISGPSTICNGASGNWGVLPVANTSSYTWSLPAGWAGSGLSLASIAATVSATSGTISVTANNVCGSSAPRTLAVTVISIPAQPGAISGSTTPCINATQTYSVSPVAGAAAYNWTYPSGGAPLWAGGSTASSISLTVGAASGNITVTASNVCGTSAARSLGVSVIPLPGQPGAISGKVAPCVGNVETYKIGALSSNATYYLWFYPGGGAPIWSGASTVDTINMLVGSAAGLISVAGANACGSGVARTLAVSPIPVVTPSVVLSRSTPSDTICQGTVVTFTATPAGGGTAPSYIFRKNGAIVFSLGNAYTDPALANGDRITVAMASSLPCVTYAQVLDSIKMTVNPTITPGVNINATPPVTFCAGAVISFTTNNVGAGPSPAYQWYKNGVALAGVATPNYTSGSLANGDTLQVAMATSALCAAFPVAYSNKVGLVVSPVVSPTISISANPSGPVGVGVPVTFSIVQSGGGATPGYQWRRNGVDIAGETGSTYTTGSLSSGDAITARMLSYDPCASPTMVSSNEIVMIVGSTSVAGGGSGGWEGTVSLYPNPSGGHFTVAVAGGAQTGGANNGARVALDIINALGQHIYHTELKPSAKNWSYEVWLDEAISNGTYLIKLSADNGTMIILPFVVKR